MNAQEANVGGSMDPLSIASFGVGGLAELLKGLGVFPDPQQQKNQAMLKYLQDNTKDFNYVPQAFDASQHQDVLQPLAQNMETNEMATNNKLGMSGLGRSGYAQSVSDVNKRNDMQKMANTITGLARNDDQTGYNQALQTYQANLQRQQMLAGLQG